jgi:hypothetical protein
MQGFYKNDNGLLLWSADRVINEKFELWIDHKDEYEYPVEGWIWANSNGEARKILNLPGRQYYPSWTLNLETYMYEAPIAYPNDGKEYVWDEELGNWVEALAE